MIEVAVVEYCSRSLVNFALPPAVTPAWAVTRVHDHRCQPVELLDYLREHGRPYSEHRRQLLDEFA